MIAIVHTWDRTSLSKVESLVKQGVQFSRIFLLGGQEWEYSDTIGGRVGGIYILLEVAKKQNLILEIITGSAKESKLLIDTKFVNYYRMHYWENYWLTQTYSAFLQKAELGYIEQDIRQDIFNKNYDFCIVSLNNRPHTHRCLMIDLMAKYSLIDNNAVSWREATYSGEYTKQGLLPSVSRGYKYQYWEPKLLILDNQNPLNFDFYSLPKEYHKSFCQLVIESTIDVPFFTEKTSIPLLCLKPFIGASVQGYHKSLERRGFVLYTELFDYSFDSIEDCEHRFEEIAKNLTRINSLSKTELGLLYDKILDKLLYNKQHAIKLATRLEYQPEILKEIYTYTLHSSNDNDIGFNDNFINYS